MASIFRKVAVTHLGLILLILLIYCRRCKGVSGCDHAGCAGRRMCHLHPSAWVRLEWVLLDSCLACRGSARVGLASLISSGYHFVVVEAVTFKMNGSWCVEICPSDVSDMSQLVQLLRSSDTCFCLCIARALYVLRGDIDAASADVRLFVWVMRMEAVSCKCSAGGKNKN